MKRIPEGGRNQQNGKRSKRYSKKKVDEIRESGRDKEVKRLEEGEEGIRARVGMKMK